MTVPEGWRERSLGEFAEEIRLRRPIGISVPVLSMTKYDGFVSSLDYFKKQVFSKDTSSYKIVKKGQFAYATIHLDEGSIDLLTEFDAGLISPMYTVFKVDSSQVDNSFMKYLLKSHRLIQSYSALGQGSINRRKSIGFKILSTLRLILPPFPEQKKIVEILGSVDEAIQATQETIEQTKRVKKGLLQDLLTKGIGHTRFKKTEIGEIPEEWEVVLLGDVINIIAGKGFKLAEYSTSGIKLLRIDNVTWGRISWDNIVYLPKEYVNKYPELMLQPGDILLALNRPITQGKLKIAEFLLTDEPAILYQRVGRIRSSSTLLNQSFAYHQLCRFLVFFIYQESVGSDQPFINITKLREAKIPLPPLEEQKVITAILSSTDNRIQIEETKLEHLEHVKKGLMQDLLTGKVRVDA